jgi:photosystem II reaction center protein Psb28
MLNLTYTYRLKLSQQQTQTYDAWLETSRRVWNFALAERKDWYNSRSCRIDACSINSEYIIPPDAPRPTFASQCKALTQARKTNTNLNAAHSQMLQQVLKAIEGFNSFTKQSLNALLLSDEEGEISVTPSSTRFIFGGDEGDELQGVECKFEIERDDHWDRFMRFMHRYADANDMEYGEN